MLHAGEVRLGGKHEQVVGAGIALAQQPVQLLAIEPQVRHGQRRVVDGRAARARELADAVHRVVVVYGEQQAAAGRERERFADVLQRAGAVRREDGRVFPG
jgi:hypothetical protein